MFHETGFMTTPWWRAAVPWLYTLMVALIGGIALHLLATPLSAHGGGVPRLTDEVAGPYRIFAWTQPEPLRVGDIHLSIAVVKGARSGEQSATGLDEPITDAAVMITLQPVNQGDAPLRVSAVLQQQLGNYYYEADATLPTAGDWRFTIEVSGMMGDGRVAFVSAVSPARQINWTLVITAGGLLVGLFVLIGVWNRLQAREATPARIR